MGTLPTGTVTFLFTDIEGSTKLAQAHPVAMHALLARHNEILKLAVNANNGFVFNIVGDSFTVAFHNPVDAMNAALDAQHALHKESWLPVQVKVRMGIHTGAAKLKDDTDNPDYDGYATLALSSRIMSAGHGGQILLSQTAHDLLTNNLPKDAQLLDMGEHNLKDVLQTQHIYQLNPPDLPAEFPPLKTQKIKNHNLPVKLTSFIGRERELAETTKRLAEARLLTLIGPGGTGKTRLSIKLGGDQLALYPDGVWLIELAPLTDPAPIMQTIASVFGLRESTGRPLIELVMDYLRAKSALIIFDNCEHLIDACAKIAETLIQTCENLKILASSREALGVLGEITYRVPSLSLPAAQNSVTSEMMEFESVHLFVDRASAANPNFKLTNDNAFSVAKVCRRLDGIPLALELAAARARVLSVEQIAERLDDRFRLLTGGSRTALPRQQTLRALIDWSYDLLSEPEKILFRRLAVFVGGWTLEAAEAVCSGERVESYEVLDLLAQLVDKSLVIAEEKSGAVRYHRLETIRQYAREKLFETNEAASIRDRHLDYFIERAKLSEKKIVSMWFGDFIHDKSIEDDNIRTALTWAVDNHPVKAMELVTLNLTVWTWFLQGYIFEIRDWCETILARVDSLPPEDIQPDANFLRLKARLWNRLAQALMNLGDHTGSQSAAEKSVALARELSVDEILSEALGSVGIGALYSGNPEYAQKVTEEGIEISESKGYPWVKLWTYNTMIHIANITGDKAKAQEFKDKHKAVLREEGASVDPAEDKLDQSEKAFLKGEIETSVRLTEEALAILADRGDKYRLVNTLSGSAHFLREQGQLAEALVFYRRSIRLWQDFGHRGAVAHQLECFGLIALVKGQPARAAKLISAAESLREVVNSVRTPTEQKEFEGARLELKTHMDESEFNNIWQEGRSMTMEQAIEFALEENE